jgi:hypothetical protein
VGRVVEDGGGYHVAGLSWVTVFSVVCGVVRGGCDKCAVGCPGQGCEGLGGQEEGLWKWGTAHREGVLGWADGGGVSIKVVGAWERG